jgi:hypothetical protein
MKSHHLCIGGGGACKGPGVVHFFHLCSRSSDDIAVPNQIKCDACVANRRVEFYCKDVCDSDCIEDAKTQLAHLEIDKMGLKIVALCKVTVSKSVWDSPKECPWATLYSMSPLHLVPVGVAPGLYVAMVDTRCYNKLINDTLIMFDLVNSDGVTTVPERDILIEKYVLRLCRLKKYHDVLSY